MPSVVFYLLVFLGVGTFFLFFHLTVGKIIRPAKPEADKLTIYECGEPTVGTAWIQFDLRYYVVALLFVIFDVEVAFFFPWAVVFGSANDLARADYPAERREAITKSLTPNLPPLPGETRPNIVDPDVAQSFAWLAFYDILVFFSVLMVGFAYVWRRGDIDWVRSTAAETAATAGAAEFAVRREEKVLVGSA